MGQRCWLTDDKTKLKLFQTVIKYIKTLFCFSCSVHFGFTLKKNPSVFLKSLGCDSTSWQVAWIPARCSAASLQPGEAELLVQRRVIIITSSPTPACHQDRFLRFFYVNRAVRISAWREQRSTYRRQYRAPVHVTMWNFTFTGTFHGKKWLQSTREFVLSDFAIHWAGRSSTWETRRTNPEGVWGWSLMSSKPNWPLWCINL